MTPSARYEVVLILPAVLTGDPILQIAPLFTPSPDLRTRKMGLVRLRVALTTAVASSFGLELSNNVSVPTTPILSSAAIQTSEFNGGPGAFMGQIAYAWSQAPTFAVGVNAYRAESLPAVAMVAYEWTWPEDDPFFSSPVLERSVAGGGQGVVLRNIGAGTTGAMQINVAWREFL